jgi:hypothetical protein
MAHEAGDTARLLRDIGVGTLVPIDDAGKIATGLSVSLAAIEGGRARVATPEEAALFSRAARAKDLAAVLDAVAGFKPAAQAREPALV